MTLPIEKIRKDFPILSQKVKGKPLVYLDNAATSQKPLQVVKAIDKYYREYNSNVHRGIHALAERATAEYEGAREKIAKFINARKPEEIIFTRGTTEAINLVAYSWARKAANGGHGLKAGDTILLSVMEHHSNIVPWQILAKEKGVKIEYLDIDEEGKLKIKNRRGIFFENEKLKIKNLKLVALTHVSNVLGTINPVKEIIRFSKTLNPKPHTLVDAAQAVPHMRVDVQSLGCDFLAFSGHKMCGPTGIGVLYIRGEIADQMPPFLGGGEMIREVYLDHSEFKEPPYRFEAGTPHIAGAIGLGAAVDYLSGLGMENIRAHGERLTAYGLERLSKIEGLKIYGPKGSSERGPVLSFTVEGIHPHDLATVLDEEGIAIRSGHHCAMPLHNRLGLIATARASFYFYNTEEEVDKLVEGIESAKRVFQI